MLYSWDDRAAYVRYQTNEFLSQVEAKTGRLADDVRDAVIAEADKAFRTVIMDVIEELRR